MPVLKKIQINVQPDFQSLFEAAPGLYLILQPDFTIVAVSDSYLKATMTQRKKIIGRKLFEVFPDNPDDPSATGVTNLRTSLNYVLKNKTTHVMAVQKYDIRRPDGTFEERYWSPLNKPVFDKNNKLAWIIHHVEDVTDFMRLKNKEVYQTELTDDLKRKMEKMEADIYKRSEEIQKSHQKLKKEISEHKKIEGYLKEIEDKFQKIFQLSPTGITLTNAATGKWEDVNESFLKMTGYSREEIIGRSSADLDLYAPEIRKEILGEIEQKGSVKNKEVAFKKRSGETATALFSNEEIFLNGKKYIISINYDITEQKQAEKKFKSLLESAPDAMVITNEKGEIVLLNQQTENLFGYSREELIGQKVEILIPENFKKSHVAHRHQYFAEPKRRPMGIGMELFAQRKDETRFPVEISLSPIKTEEGTLVLASVRDITERKRLEEQLKRFNKELEEQVNSKTGELIRTIKQLKESEEKYKTIFYKSPLPKWIYDLETLRFLEVNEEAIRHYGYTEEEFLNMTIKDIRPKEDLDLLFEDLKKILPGKITRHGAWRHLKKNGEIIIVETTAHSIDYNGRPARMVVANDVTQRIQSEKQLVAERTLLRSLIDNLPEFIYIKDTGSKYLLANTPLVELVGAVSENELIGKTVLDLFGPEIAPINFEEDKEIFETGKFVLNREETIFRKNGNQMWLLTSKVPLKDENNKVIGLIGISRDITERKHTEILLEQLNERLKKRAAELLSSNMELERFAYVASHDLQEPLRMVSSFLELLEIDLQGKLEETTQQYIRFAVDGAERMKKLIQDLLEYSRVGTTKEEAKETDMNEVINSVLSMLALTIHEKKAKLSVQHLPVIPAVKSQMQQLFQNFVSNALKYSGDKIPEIQIGYYDKGETFQFYVKDNGIGIEPRFFEKIFIIFQRLHPRSEYSGTGIGLAICKKIVERHNGKIWVESEPGKGTVFYTELPKHIR